MTNLEITIALAADAAFFQDSQAMKLFSWFPPLSEQQIRSLSRSSDYHAARRALLRQPAWKGVDEKSFSELVYCGRRLHVWEAMREEPRLRPVQSAKALAKVIRERLSGADRPVAVKLDAAELDKVEAEALAAIKRLNTSPERVARLVRAAMKDEPAAWHAFALTTLFDVWNEINDQLAKRNQKLWAEPKHAFLNRMKAWKLLKLPAPR